MVTSEVLAGALAFLHDGDGWTHEAFARNSDGDCCPVHSLYAVTFCMRGAICKATGDERIGDDFNLALAVLSQQFHGNCAQFNDNPKRSFGQVREVFMRAISSAEFSERRTWTL